MKRILLLCLLLSLCLASCAENGEITGESSSAVCESSGTVSDAPSEIELSEEPEPDPLERVWESVEVISDYDIRYDANGMFVFRSDVGLVLQKQDMEKSLYPASITKLVTALTALDLVSPVTVFTAGDELDFVEPDSTVAYIRKGQSLTAEMLIRGMLLPSGCDASYVLAAGVGRLMNPDVSDAAGAVEAFVEGMNRWSEENGLVNSHWVNPDGYHDNDHSTCMADLLRVADLCCRNAVIRDCASCGSIDVVYASGETNHWNNTNAFVRKDSSLYDPSCIGLKTGTTDEAGACLLSCFEEDGVLTIIGVFGCKELDSRYAISSELRSRFRLI